MKLKLLFTLALVSNAYAIDIQGIYQSNDTILEVFKKGEDFYAAGFQSSNEKSKEFYAKVFMKVSCKENTCKGKIFNLVENKGYYPVVVSQKDQYLKVKVDVFFGPTFEWKKITNPDFPKRPKFEDLDFSLFSN